MRKAHAVHVYVKRLVLHPHHALELQRQWVAAAPDGELEGLVKDAQQVRQQLDLDGLHRGTTALRV